MSTPAAAAPAVETTPLVEFDRVSVRGAARPALSEISLHLARSELALLTGPGGAGKTLLLRLVAGIARPDSGAVRVAGQSVAQMKPAALALLRRSMGIVGDDLPLLADRSLHANVALPALLAGLGRREAGLRADAALERVGLDPALGAQRVDRLPGSARQRAALARAIVNRPALLLLDRPTFGLAAGDAGQLMQLLETFSVAGVCVLVADAEPVRSPRARVLRLEQGRLVGDAA